MQTVSPINNDCLLYVNADTEAEVSPVGVIQMKLLTEL
jgi:hypothetical protein